MKMSNLKITIAVLSILLLSTSPIFAWGQSHPRAMGMAGAYTALGTGLEATAYNPANLGLSNNRSFSLDFVGFGLSLKNNSFSLSDYNKYNGQFLDTDDKEAILDRIPAEGLNLNLLTEANVLSFSINRVALSFRTFGASKLNLDKDPFELFLYGNAVKSEVNLSDTKGEAFGIGDAALSYGHPIKKWEGGELAVGITTHFFYGAAYEKIVHAEGGVNTTDDGFTGDGTMIIRQCIGGQGFGMDIGVAMIFENNWVFSAGLQNLYSQINWNGQPEETVFTFEFTEPINFDDIADDDSDSLVESSDTTYDINAFTTRLSPVFKIGLSRTLNKLTWAVDWEQGTISSASQSVTPRISTGLEYKAISFLPVRMGVSFGGDRGNILATGFGIYMGPYQIDFAIANNGSFNPNSTKGLDFGFAMGLRF